MTTDHHHHSPSTRGTTTATATVMTTYATPPLRLWLLRPPCPHPALRPACFGRLTPAPSYASRLCLPWSRCFRVRLRSLSRPFRLVSGISGPFTLPISTSLSVPPPPFLPAPFGFSPDSASPSLWTSHSLLRLRGGSPSPSLPTSCSHSPALLSASHRCSLTSNPSMRPCRTCTGFSLTLTSPRRSLHPPTLRPSLPSDFGFATTAGGSSTTGSTFFVRSSTLHLVRLFPGPPSLHPPLPS